eukprot:gene12758-3486_t
MSNQIPLVSIVLSQFRHGLIEGQRKEIAAECEKLFKRIDDLLLNVDKLTNINHPTHHQRINANLLQLNYRNFCFRMIKQLASEINEKAHNIYKQLKGKAIKPWLKHIANVMKKMVWMWGKFFNGIEILEQQDKDGCQDNMILFNKFSDYEMRQYMKHIGIATKEIRRLLPECNVKAMEENHAKLRKLEAKLLETYGRRRTGSSSQPDQINEMQEHVTPQQASRKDNKLTTENYCHNRLANLPAFKPVRNHSINRKRGRSEIESDATPQESHYPKKVRFTFENCRLPQNIAVHEPWFKLTEKFVNRSRKTRPIFRDGARSGCSKRG